MWGSQTPVRTMAALDTVGSGEGQGEGGDFWGVTGEWGKVMGKVTAPRGKGDTMTPGHTP